LYKTKLYFLVGSNKKMSFEDRLKEAKASLKPYSVSEYRYVIDERLQAVIDIFVKNAPKEVDSQLQDLVERAIKRQFIYTWANYHEEQDKFKTKPKYKAVFDQLAEHDIGIVLGQIMTDDELIEASAIVEYAQRILRCTCDYLEMKEKNLESDKFSIGVWQEILEEMEKYKWLCYVWVVYLPLYTRLQNKEFSPQCWMHIFKHLYSFQDQYQVHIKILRAFVNGVIPAHLAPGMQKAVEMAKLHFKEYRENPEISEDERALTLEIEKLYLK